MVRQASSKSLEERYPAQMVSTRQGAQSLVDGEAGRLLPTLNQRSYPVSPARSAALISSVSRRTELRPPAVGPPRGADDATVTGGRIERPDRTVTTVGRDPGPDCCQIHAHVECAKHTLRSRDASITDP